MLCITFEKNSKNIIIGTKQTADINMNQTYFDICRGIFLLDKVSLSSKFFQQKNAGWSQYATNFQKSAICS